MKSDLEKERKFLIKLPLSQEAQDIIINNSDAPAHIVQTYLDVQDNYSERVRMTSVEMWGRMMPAHYSHTVKKFVSPGINEESESCISQSEYETNLENSDSELENISKTRYFVNWKNKIFELDMFHAQHEGLAILEIELQDMTESVELPPFLEVIREVTGEREYSNSSLAKINNEI